MFEFMGKNLIKVMLIVSFALLAGCAVASKKEGFQNPQLQERIGAQFVQSFEKSAQVLVARMERGQDQQWTGKKPHVLTKEKVDALKTLLLNDSSYIFDKTKKCLFIPELGFRIEGEKDLQIMVSPSCNQVKFIQKERAVILDYDPIAEKLNPFCKEILEQLEKDKT